MLFTYHAATELLRALRLIPEIARVHYEVEKAFDNLELGDFMVYPAYREKPQACQKAANSVNSSDIGKGVS